MKIVLDTNILVSGIFWQGAPGQVLELWIAGKFTVVCTEDILREYTRVIHKFSSPKRTALIEHWTAFLIENTELIVSTSELNLCRDPDDNKFINCAISSGTKYIVSGDDDLLTLKSINDVKIMTAAAFIKMRTSY